MMRFYCIGFLCLMAFDTTAQICFKFVGLAAEPLEFNLEWLLRVVTSPWSYGALAGYLCSFVTWMTLLRYAPIGPAFAASHLELISVTVLSAWLFHEPLTFPKIAGGLLILIGVLCLAKDESAGAAKDDHDHAVRRANQH
ncbi:MAG: EamA family transporter [Deltaproteobacteria bacterium]|jgi:drug/metabolite transporter (DMT)-like permease|nr:EamA family transporter [Deltaproteobacteria bacterium]